MTWFDCAVHRPISGGTSGPLRAQRGLVLHHAVANGSLWGLFNNGQVSTQFWVSRSGLIEQYLSASVSAWATGSSVGNFEYNSVETEGCAAPPHAEPMTDAMVQALARLYAEGHRRLGWPFQLANAPGANGFAYHRLFSATACPCDVRVNRRAEILAIAQGGPGPEPEPPKPPTPKPEEVPPVAVTPVVGPFRLGQSSFFQVVQGQLWHKWTGDAGRTWREEVLIAPAGVKAPVNLPAGVKLRDTVGAAVVDGTLFGTCEADNGAPWVARQTSDVTTGWDIRRAQPGA